MVHLFGDFGDLGHEGEGLAKILKSEFARNGVAPRHLRPLAELA
jgi:hypothetical protein